MAHSEAELRAMLTARQKELEEIAFRCARSGFAESAQLVADAMKSLIAAKVMLVTEDAESQTAQQENP